jgi:hypothetical protein
MRETPEEAAHSLVALGKLPPPLRLLGAPCWLGADLARTLGVPVESVEHTLQLARDRVQEGRDWLRLTGPEREAVVAQAPKSGAAPETLADPLLVLFARAIVEPPFWLSTPAANDMKGLLGAFVLKTTMELQIGLDGIRVGLPPPRPDLRIVPDPDDV